MKIYIYKKQFLTEISFQVNSNVLREMSCFRSLPQKPHFELQCLIYKNKHNIFATGFLLVQELNYTFSFISKQSWLCDIADLLAAYEADGKPKIFRLENIP